MIFIKERCVGEVPGSRTGAELKKVRYNDLKIYMHNLYINGKDCWLKILLAALDVLVKW